MKERRQSARLVDEVNFNLGYEKYDLSSTTINLSANGLLCRVPQQIPVMTKIQMALLVPDSDPQHPPRKIKANGVIVRVEKDQEGLFKIAVFFTEMSEAHRRTLQHYIESKIREKES